MRIIAIGLLLATGLSCGSDGEESARFSVKDVSRGTLRIVVAATGEVQPLRQIELKSKASGEVIRFAKREGNVVKENELIVELDPDSEQRNLKRAEADRDTAKAQLQLTKLEHIRSLKTAESELASTKADAAWKKSEYERLKGLPDSVSLQDLETARINQVLADQKQKQAEAELDHVRDKKEADELLATARLTQAEVALAEARDRVKDTSILSPINGILLQKLVEEGQIVASGISATSGGTPLAVVADTSVMVVEANIDETDIGRVKMEHRVEITVDAHPTKRFPGTIDLIPPLGELESNIRVYRVRILVSGEDLDLLKTGMTANVEIIISERKNVVLVPSEAIKRDEEGIHVLIQEGEAKKRVAVTVGEDTGAEAEITEGLKEGQKVVVTYDGNVDSRRRRR